MLKAVQAQRKYSLTEITMACNNSNNWAFRLNPPPPGMDITSPTRSPVPHWEPRVQSRAERLLFQSHGNSSKSPWGSWCCGVPLGSDTGGFWDPGTLGECPKECAERDQSAPGKPSDSPQKRTSFQRFLEPSQTTTSVEPHKWKRWRPQVTWRATVRYKSQGEDLVYFISSSDVQAGIRRTPFFI